MKLWLQHFQITTEVVSQKVQKCVAIPRPSSQIQGNNFTINATLSVRYPVDPYLFVQVMGASSFYILGGMCCGNGKEGGYMISCDMNIREDFGMKFDVRVIILPLKAMFSRWCYHTMPWRHRDMGMLYASPALCKRDPQLTSGSPKRGVCSFDVFLLFSEYTIEEKQPSYQQFYHKDSHVPSLE